jgi:hypothetical protein
MSDADRDKVKSIARELLATLKAEKLALDWRKRQQSRAEVRVTIETLLDQGLPRVYTPELCEKKTTAVFQHVYDATVARGAVCMWRHEYAILSIGFGHFKDIFSLSVTFVISEDGINKPCMKHAESLGIEHA